MNRCTCTARLGLAFFVVASLGCGTGDDSRIAADILTDTGLGDVAGDIREVDDTAPDIDDTAPDIDDTAPDIDDTAPDIDDTAPDIDDTAPDIDDTAPDSDDTAPDSDDTAPDIDDTAPDIDDTAEVEDTRPDVDDSTTDTDGETSAEDTPVTTETTDDADVAHETVGDTTVDTGELETNDLGDAAPACVDLDGDGYGSGPGCLGPDCSDRDATRYPGAPERCDGVDHDCDGAAFDADAIDLVTWHRDADGDGFGDAALTLQACRAPAGWVADATDCDDGARETSPAAHERCNGVDDDCDGATDEDGAIDASAWFFDSDGDGYGAGEPRMACSAIAGYALELDCDDGDDSRYPGAPERCGGVDHDCDGDVNEGSSLDALAWHPDADKDGHGNQFLIYMACSAPAGWLADGSDCDDDSALARPGGVETCDHRDNDCDGVTDEDSALGVRVWFRDEDGDQHGLATVSMIACFAPAGYVASNDDCDDKDATRYGGAPEYCDGVDHDCDGAVNEDGSVDAARWYVDDDDDGFGDPATLRRSCAPIADLVPDAGDCDDGDDAVNPDATEVCDDIDNDCDEVVDEDDAADATPWYADVDEDHHGDPDVVWVACDAPAGYIADDTDCDDGDDAVHPGAAEYCDGVDLDCDSLVDQGDSLDAGTWHVDADHDGYGSDATVHACVQPAGTVIAASDCDDTRAQVHPGAVEICNGLDDDCDASTSETGLALDEASVPIGGYAGRQLRGANFDCQRLAGVSFDGADLRGASFRYADLRGANFYGANLRWADLEGADLRGVVLTNADLTGASVRSTRF